MSNECSEDWRPWLGCHLKQAFARMDRSFGMEGVSERLIDALKTDWEDKNPRDKAKRILMELKKRRQALEHELININGQIAEESEKL